VALQRSKIIKILSVFNPVNGNRCEILFFVLDNLYSAQKAAIKKNLDTTKIEALEKVAIEEITDLLAPSFEGEEKHAVIHILENIISTLKNAFTDVKRKYKIIAQAATDLKFALKIIDALDKYLTWRETYTPIYHCYWPI
jgi:hypothetical protein